MSKSAPYISTSTMDPKVKARWVAALRSDKYKQTKGKLEKLNRQGEYVGNCCLGVLCRIQKIKPRILINGDFAFDNNEVTLSMNLRDKFGLQYLDVRELIKLNDHSPLGFHKIADFIERNVDVNK